MDYSNSELHPTLRIHGWASLDDLNQHLEALGLYLNAPEPAIICRTCKYALKLSKQSNSVTRHISKHGISPQQYKKLTGFIRTLQLPDPKTLPLRQDKVLPHPFLTIREGSVCSNCDYRTSSSELFDRHIKKHIGKGKKTHSVWKRDSGSHGVLLQSWNENGSSGFWIVQAPRDHPSTAGSGEQGNAAHKASLSRCLRVEQMHRLEQQRVNEQGADIIVEPNSSDTALVSNWTRRTGWNELFRGENRTLLVQLIQLPQTRLEDELHLGRHEGQEIISSLEDELKLKYISAAIDRALECCRDTVRHTDISIRCWVRSHYPDRPYKAPFELPGRPSTQVKYDRVIKQCFFFWIRFWRLSESATKPIFRRRLTNEQRKALDQMWSHPAWPSVLQTDIVSLGSREEKDNNKEEVEGGEDLDEATDDDYDDDDDCLDNNEQELEALKKDLSLSEMQSDLYPYDEAVGSSSHTFPYSVITRRPIDDCLMDIILQLAYFFATEEYEDGKSCSTLLIYFTSVLGISKDGATFERPLNYTPKLSAIAYCIRLILLEATLPRFPHNHIGWKSRPRRGQLDLLNRVRVEKMCLGSQAPMGEIISLRSYGRALCRSEGPSFRVHWSEDGQVISWDNYHMSMGQFRTISATVLERAKFCCKRLMYDWQPVHNLNKVRDQLANVTSGYSFVSDPENNLLGAYMELSRIACLAACDGLMTDDDWDENAVQRYLRLHDEFQGLLMLIIFLWGGQAPRGPDLLTVEHCNSPSNRRSVCIYAGTIIIVSAVNKARRATNQEFYVVRVLPKEAAELLFLYLVYIRPFICTLYRRCLNREIHTSLLFFSVNDPTSLWKTNYITKLLKENTNMAVSIPIGVREYRQLTIAITEKHVKQISKPFNQYDDKSRAADTSVAFAWQSGHRPLQRGLSYGLDGAFPDRLQPALIELYCWISREWHIFLQQRNPVVTQQFATTNLKRSFPVLGTMQPIPKRHRLELPSPVSLTGNHQEQDVLPQEESDNRRGGAHANKGDSLYTNISGPWAARPEMQLLEKAAAIPWPGCLALFGRPGIENGKLVQELQQMIEHIQEKERQANHHFDWWGRLRFSKQFTRWRNVGCQLCYVNNGEPELDHAMRDCTLWPSSTRARDILNWLEKLPVPKFLRGLGCCSLCTLTDCPCEAVRLGCHAAEAEIREVRARWAKQLEVRLSTNSLCENKPIVMQAIAALCAYDEQILGKVLVSRFSEQDRVDFAAENQVSLWFSAKVPFRDDWVPRMLFVFEMLVWAFDFRSQGLLESLNPTIITREGVELIPMGWDDKEEIQSWKRAVEWWVDKCGFCVGKGLLDTRAHHTLRQCPRGGATYIKSGLGESIHLEGFMAEGGCRTCGVPRKFCQKWQEIYDGEWCVLPSKQCQYRTILYDTIIGLYHCGDEKFQMDILDAILEEGDEDYQGCDVEDVASWLSRTLIVEGLETSYFVRYLTIWTYIVWSTKPL